MKPHKNEMVQKSNLMPSVIVIMMKMQENTPFLEGMMKMKMQALPLIRDTIFGDDADNDDNDNEDNDNDDDNDDDDENVGSTPHS